MHLILCGLHDRFFCSRSALVVDLCLDDLFLVKPLETEHEQTLLLGSRAYRYSLSETLHRYARFSIVDPNDATFISHPP